MDDHIDRSDSGERHQRDALALLSVVQADRAPDSLRAQLEAQRRAVARRRPQRSLIGFGGLVGAVAVVALALVLLLPAGTPGGPSVSQAALLALRGPSLPAPPLAPTGRGKLSQEVGKLYFPDWTRSFGWRATGQRSDRLGGRSAITVYYVHAGRTVAYTIVAAPALAWPHGATTQLDGTVLRAFTLGGRKVVTWRRDGDTCVLSARGVSVAALLRLASWKAPGARW